MNDNVVLYDFSKQNMPVVIKSWSIYGLRGVISWLGGLLAYGDEGMQWCNYGNHNRNESTESLCTPIKNVAAHQRNLYAITSDGLRVYSARLCQIASAKAEHAESVISLGDKLILGGKRGFTIMNRKDLKHCSSYMDNLEIASLRATFAGEPGLFVAQLTDGTAKSFRLSGDAPEIVSDFNDAPWRSNSISLGQLIIKLAIDNRGFDLYRVGQMELA
jgi:hypothetical protein